MATPDRIRELIERGTIPQEEGLRLLEAYTLAEERDRVVLEECRRLRAEHSSRHGGVVRGIGLGLLLAMVMALPGLLSRPSGGRAELVSVSDDPTRIIQQLERRLRRPGLAEDYRRLGRAYQQRYQDTGNAEDRQRGIEALERAARELGLTAEAAHQLAIETVAGAVRLAAQSSEAPETLRSRVTSRGGTTERALESMESERVKEAIVRAVHAAAERSRELGDELGKD